MRPVHEIHGDGEHSDVYTKSTSCSKELLRVNLLKTHQEEEGLPQPRVKRKETKTKKEKRENKNVVL